VAYVRSNVVYDADGLVLSDQISQLQSSGSTLNQTNLYFYNASTNGGVYDAAGVGTAKGAADWNGTFEAGQLTGVYTTSTLVNSAGHSTAQPTNFTVNAYAWGLVSTETSITFDPNTASGTEFHTTLGHDANGFLTSATISDGAPHTITYVNNIEGEVLSRTDTAGPINDYYYLNGRTIGAVDNAGPSQFDLQIGDTHHFRAADTANLTDLAENGACPQSGDTAVRR